MKKLILAAVILTAFSVTSCKKNYTCACTVNSVDYNFDYEKVKKKDATETCDAQESTYKAADPNATCTLK